MCPLGWLLFTKIDKLLNLHQQNLTTLLSTTIMYTPNLDKFIRNENFPVMFTNQCISIDDVTNVYCHQKIARDKTNDPLCPLIRLLFTKLYKTTKLWPSRIDNPSINNCDVCTKPWYDSHKNNFPTIFINKCMLSVLFTPLLKLM